MDVKYATQRQDHGATAAVRVGLQVCEKEGTRPIGAPMSGENERGSDRGEKGKTTLTISVDPTER